MIEINNRIHWVNEITEHGLLEVRMGDMAFGFPVRSIREISTPRLVTRVARVPSFVRGVMNLRGQIVSILDIASMLNTKCTVDFEHQRLIVLKTRNELPADLESYLDPTALLDKLAIVADRVLDMIVPTSEQIEHIPPNISDETSSCIFAMCQAPHHVIGALDPSALSAIKGPNAKNHGLL